MSKSAMGFGEGEPMIRGQAEQIVCPLVREPIRPGRNILGEGEVGPSPGLALASDPCKLQNMSWVSRGTGI